MLPHQTWTMSSSIVPFFGYYRMKEVSTAVTKSRAATGM